MLRAWFAFVVDTTFSMFWGEYLSSPVWPDRFPCDRIPDSPQCLQRRSKANEDRCPDEQSTWRQSQESPCTRWGADWGQGVEDLLVTFKGPSHFTSWLPFISSPPSFPDVGLCILIYLFIQLTLLSPLLYCGGYKGEQPSWRPLCYSEYFEIVIQKNAVKTQINELFLMY